MSRYIDLADTAFQGEARDIDGQIWMPNCQERDYDVDRRYKYSKGGELNFKVIEEHLELVDRTYLEYRRGGQNDSRIKQLCAEPLVRNPPYNGWGKLTKHRAQMHEGQQSAAESPLLALYSAVLKHLYGEEFKVHVIQLFTCFHARDADICEILGHHISSSMVSDTGLNGAAPGGMGSNNTALTQPQLDVAWVQAREHLKRTSTVADNLQANIDRIKNTARIFGSISDVEQEYSALKLKTQGFVDQVNDLSGRVRVLRATQALEKFEGGLERIRQDLKNLEVSDSEPCSEAVAPASSPPELSSQENV